jgi:putative Holliday junction resolvase
MRLIGIDYGTKRVGIALSDAGGNMGFPHAVFTNDQDLLKNVLAVARANDAELAVLGESKDNAGADNPVMASVRKFAAALEEAGLRTASEPEFYTSAEARRGPEKEERPARAGEAVDASAAALILNSFLARTRGKSLGHSP